MTDKLRRFTLFTSILVIILLLGLIFAGWVMPNIVQPVAKTVWLFLRVFILNTDQGVYWNLLIISVTIWAIVRLTRKKPTVLTDKISVTNEAVSNMKSWQEALVFSKQDDSDRNIVRIKLFHLLISHYAARRQNPDHQEIREDLEQKRLPIPDSVYNFLFLYKNKTSADHLLTIFFHTFRRWYRRITRQDAAIFNRMIDELIDFLNT